MGKNPILPSLSLFRLRQQVGNVIKVLLTPGRSYSQSADVSSRPLSFPDVTGNGSGSGSRQVARPGRQWMGSWELDSSSSPRPGRMEDRLRMNSSEEPWVRSHRGYYGRHFIYCKKNPSMIQSVFPKENWQNLCWSNCTKSGLDHADRILDDPFWTPDAHDERVQAKLRRVLEEIYDPEFLECSHGFRPGFSQLTCLRQVRRDYQGTVWFIAVELSKHLSTLRYPVVLGLIKRKIRDSQFLSLVDRGLKGEMLITSVKAGASAELMRSCAPILTNIVLHELDKFCMRLKRIIDRGKLIDGRILSWKTVDAATTAPFPGLPSDGNETKLTKFGPAKVLQDSYSRRFHYVRFGNEVLCGVVGPHALADRLVALLIRFLKVRLHLDLTEDDFEITRAKGEKIPFLGYLIGRNPDFAEKLVHVEDGKKRVDKVLKPGKLTLIVDKDKVVRRLAEKGFCTKGGEPRPNFRYFQMAQSESVSKIGAILKGLAEYYHLAESKKRAILYFNWIMRSSLAKTFAAKFKLRSQRKVYKRGTRDLSRPIARQTASKKKNVYIPESEKPHNQKGKMHGRRMQGLPFTRSRLIPGPDTKPMPRDWKPVGR